jgi:DNA-directed RNA polymerase specialized sigma24 family protein
VRYETIPDEILENIEDINAGMPDLVGALRLLPGDQALALLGRYVLGLSHTEISRAMRRSRTHEQRLIAMAEVRLKAIIKKVPPAV